MFSEESQNLTYQAPNHKMVSHTQIFRRQQPTNCLSVFDHFAELALKGLKPYFVLFKWTLHDIVIIFLIWST